MSGVAVPHLPSWGELREGVIRGCEQHPQAERLLSYFTPEQRRLRKHILSTACAIIRPLGSGSDIGRLCQRSQDEILLFAVDQVLQNCKCGDNDEPSPDWLFRAHNQLPCTPATLRKRVSDIQCHVDLQDAVLVVGDDDLQSLELARNGFSDITVVEIDPAIADRIERAPEARLSSIRVIREDITKVALSQARPYAAILMDPPCNLDGLRAFLDGALRLHSGGGEHLVFLNTHLLSLPGTDYELAMECMRQNRLKLVELQRGYNRYSIPRLPRMFLSALLRVIEPCMACPLHHFSSDLLILCRRPAAAKDL